MPYSLKIYKYFQAPQLGHSRREIVRFRPVNKINSTLLTKYFIKSINTCPIVLSVFSHLLPEDLGLLVGSYIIIFEFGFLMLSTCVLNEGMNE